MLQSIPLTGDLWALVAVIALAMAQLTLSSILTLRQLGPRWVLSPRDVPAEVTGISGRIVRAHRNLLEIFPQFVAALLVVHAAGVNSDLAVIGAWTFFGGRVAYVPAYAFGPTGLRPICWTVAQIGVLVVLADIIA